MRFSRSVLMPLIQYPQSTGLNVRFGSKADACTRYRDVRLCQKRTSRRQPWPGARKVKTITISAPAPSNSSSDLQHRCRRRSAPRRPLYRFLCASAERQVGGSPRSRCWGVRSSRAWNALRAALASLAVMGSRADMGKSSQAVYRGSSSFFSWALLPSVRSPLLLQLLVVLSPRHG